MLDEIDISTSNIMEIVLSSYSARAGSLKNSSSTILLLTSIFCTALLIRSNPIVHPRKRQLINPIRSTASIITLLR